MSILGLYPQDLKTDNFYFQRPGRIKRQCFYQKLLKEGNCDQKYLICLDLRDNKFEVLFSAITLDKVDPECAETVKDKPTRKDSGLITYSNTINISGS